MTNNKALVIVIAEDDLDDTHVIRQSFEKHPAFSKVIVVKNGKELWQHLKSAEQPVPHIILTDISMPILNGVEVLQKIANDESLSAIPVFMYSSSTNVIYEQKCKELGVREFFLKPFDLSAFDLIPEKVLDNLKRMGFEN